jgi:hypothetical protein
MDQRNDPEARDKSWLKRHIIWSAVVAVVLLLIIIGAISFTVFKTLSIPCNRFTETAYTGTVAQIVESPYGLGNTIYVAVAKAGSAQNESSTLSFMYLNHTEAVQGDTVKISGYLIGPETYPANTLWACEIDDQTRAIPITTSTPNDLVDPGGPPEASNEYPQ